MTPRRRTTSPTSLARRSRTTRSFAARTSARSLPLPLPLSLPLQLPTRTRTPRTLTRTCSRTRTLRTRTLRRTPRTGTRTPRRPGRGHDVRTRPLQRRRRSHRGTVRPATPTPRIRNMDIWRNTPMRWRRAFSKVLYAVTFILLAIAASLSGSHNGGPFHGGRGASPRTATE